MDRRLLLASGAYIDLSEYLLKSEAETLYAPLDAILNKQDKLISGTNIKTINGNSLLGGGDITISGGGDYLPLTGGLIDGDLSVLGTLASPTLIMAPGGVQGHLRSGDYILGLYNGGIVWGEEALNEYYITANGDGTKFLSNDGTYKTISSGGSSSGGEDIRYFTEFTVEDFIEACETVDIITNDTVELFNAMKSNKVICVPYRGYDKGFIVASYKSGEDEEFPSMYLQKGDVEYYAWTGDSHELVGEYPIYNGVQVVEMAGGEVILECLDNHIYKITDPVDYLLPFCGQIQKGVTIHFMSGEFGTTLEMYGVFWANGEIPQIEPNTCYELSLMQNADDSGNAVLTPFKFVE